MNKPLSERMLASLTDEAVFDSDYRDPEVALVKHWASEVRSLERGVAGVVPGTVDAFGYDMPPRDRRIREFAREFGCVQFWDDEYQSLVCAHRGGVIEPIRTWNEVNHSLSCEAAIKDAADRVTK